VTKYSQNFYTSVTKRASESSKITAEILSTVIDPRSIIDIGSGEGIWLDTLGNAFPSASNLTAIDLQPHESKYFQELADKGSNFTFIERNFEIDHKLPNTTYDLGICLEVLEHLQCDTAELLAEEFGRKFSVLVFSAAVKGQGGTGHINERSLDSWLELLRKQKFVALDVLRPELKKNRYVPQYYKQNMILFWHPDNCKKNNVTFNLEALLKRYPLQVSDTRGLLTKYRHVFTSLIPDRIVSRIVSVLDKTLRR
jgi:2-polyprenyl-3-methyl-5-hydroxy-6-metoxy-1,4-benzoquinol methylase